MKGTNEKKYLVVDTSEIRARLVLSTDDKEAVIKRVKDHMAGNDHVDGYPYCDSRYGIYEYSDEVKNFVDISNDFYRELEL